MTSITNLAIAGAGLTTIGGMVYGSYELLKDVPKPVAELLKIKKRVLLNKESDTEAWNKSWQQYIKDNTKTEIVDQPEGIPVAGASPTPAAPKKVTREVINTEDTWKLKDWTEQKDKPNVAPASFKDKCEEKSKGKQAGIWIEEYKKFEKYCTKNAPDEE